jgi:hypothetical protein
MQRQHNYQLNKDGRNTGVNGDFSAPIMTDTISFSWNYLRRINYHK